GARLHEHLVARAHDVADALRRERDAILLGLNLVGGAHNHGARPSTSPAWITSPAATFLPSCGCTRPIVIVPPMAATSIFVSTTAMTVPGGSPGAPGRNEASKSRTVPSLSSAAAPGCGSQPRIRLK